MKAISQNLFHSLSPETNSPNEIVCVIEIPKGCTNKYEYDHEKGFIRLDRVLYESVFYPSEYGFIPQTWDDDNDPLDIMVLSTFATFPGCVVIAKPIAALRLIDSGAQDNKIIAVAAGDPRFAHFKDLSDLSAHHKKELKNFWENYAELQPDKTIKIEGWSGRNQAWKIIEKARESYQEQFPSQQ